jgi:hypothetical protein
MSTDWVPVREQDFTDLCNKWKPHQRRTEGSQSAYIRVICGKKNSYQGTADYADEKDGADEIEITSALICVHPCSSVIKKNSYPGTADYADEQDTADEEKRHQRRTEGSQSAYIRAICGKKTVAREPQITRMKRIPQMNGNPISGNLCTSVFICG